MVNWSNSRELKATVSKLSLISEIENIKLFIFSGNFKHFRAGTSKSLRRVNEAMLAK